jgi:hypothetical protein
MSACGANRQQQGWGSFGLSVANMFGFGGLIEQADPTPLDKLQTKIQQEQSSTQELINNSALVAAQAGASVAKANDELIRKSNNVLTQEMQLHDEILNEKITSNTTYIAVIFIILMIVYIYLVLAT